MTFRAVATEYDRTLLLRFIGGHKLPFTANITSGIKRSSKQNRLNRQWMNDISEQMDGWSAEFARGYCKLHFGVPILRNEDEAFRLEYDAIIMPLPYEHKLKLMMVPFDFGVTRLMKVPQQTAYLNAVQQHFAEQGVVLTDPEGLLKAAQDEAA